MKLIECSSFADAVGCHAVGAFAALTAHLCHVARSEKALVEVAAGARAELDSCQLEKAVDEGVLVESAGSWVSLEGCAVAETRGSCVLVRKGAKAALKWCKLERSKDWNGLDSHDVGTEVHLEQCTVRHNKQNGVSAVHGSVGKAIACRSVGNEGYGYSACSQGHITAIDCSSDGNGAGASGSAGDGVVVKERLWVGGALEA